MAFSAAPTLPAARLMERPTARAQANFFSMTIFLPRFITPSLSLKAFTAAATDGIRYGWYTDLSSEVAWRVEKGSPDREARHILIENYERGPPNIADMGACPAADSG